MSHVDNNRERDASPASEATRAPEAGSPLAIEAGSPLAIEHCYNSGDSFREFPESGNYWLANGPKSGGLREAYLRGDIGIAWRRAEGADWEAPKCGLLLKVNRCASNALKPKKSRYPRGANFGLHRNALSNLSV